MRYATRYLLAGMVVFVLGILLPRPTAAQQPAVTGQQAVASAPADREQLESYIRTMTTELERSEARVNAVRAQLVSLDDDIESRMDRMVSLLTSVRDSTDASGRRMRKAKENALAGLMATARYYAQERDRRKKEMGNRYALSDDDALAQNVAALNARIETRVTQSLAIAKSLVQHEEGRTGRYRDEDIDYNRETDEYQRTRRDAQNSVRIKVDVVGDLRASIDKLTRDVEAREAELRSTTDPQRREQLSNDIQTMRQTIEARRNQIEELIRAPAPSTQPVASQAAFELDKMLDEMTAELKKDFMAFRRLVGELDAARARVNPLKARLKKAQAMLQAKQASEP